MNNQLDILSGNEFPIIQEFIITVAKENSESSDDETKRICKILKFSSDWKFEDILYKISKLESHLYPNLLIFVIETENFHDQAYLMTFLIYFSGKRPIILQLTSRFDNMTKIFYKELNSEEFLDIKEQADVTSNILNFPTFLRLYLSRKIDNFEDVMLEKLPNVKNSSLILRFLKTLELTEEFSDNLVLKCAAEGSLLDLLAAIDGFIDEEVNVQGFGRNYLAWEFNSTSVLHTTVLKPNHEIVAFLIKNCTNLIQQLPFQHQVEITTAAFASNQLEVLYDLLEISDFPFPKDFKPESATEDRLRKIVADRDALHAAVLAENLSQIDKFIKTKPGLKFAYSIKNKTALAQAYDSEKLEVCFHLKTFGFKDTKINDLIEKEGANKYARIQRIKNVDISTCDENKAVMLLATKSLIFGRYQNAQADEEQRNKILNWLREIYKTKFGSKLFDAAAQCDQLKIIFDFDYKSVENVDVSSTSASLGTTYPISKNIFIGAKLTGEKKREQQIKGVVAHEICHYVMRLVYQNNENPYYKDDENAKIKFDQIVTEIESMLFPASIQLEEIDEDEEKQATEQVAEEIKNDEEKNAKSIDDECKGTISTVYSLYNKKDWHPELIVRPAHIQAQFDDNEDKLKELEEKYEKLFEFFVIFVIPELEKFNLMQRRNVQNFNNFVGLLSEMQESSIEFATVKDIPGLISNQLIIVTTNVPKLLLIDVCKHITDKFGNLVNAQNIFITPKMLENSHIFNNFQKILKEDRALNVFANCSEETGKISAIATSAESKFLFIVSSEKQCKELSKKIKEKMIRPSKITINYNWMDLNPESQEILLQTKVNFQNNLNFTLTELILNEADTQHEDQLKFKDFEEIFNDQLLNLMVEGAEIKINQFIEGKDDKHFRVLFQARILLKNFKIFPKSEEILQEKMLEDVKNEKFVLVSDKAGSGKSWVLKNFKKLLGEKYPEKWMTYVDLKQFVSKFKTKVNKLDFASFMTTKILKPTSKFEVEIFKKLYKKGKVCILFDGFDEIAPDCAEIVSKLFQSFQQNGGNQLWIATRDYFEVSLKKDLKIDVVYKLNEFTEEHGIELIATSWMLSEIEEKNASISENELVTLVKSFRKLQNYKEIAKKLCTNVIKSDSSTIGLPQFYKMIADITKNSKNAATDYTTFRLFKKCVDIQYERWSKEKGELRSKANTKSQQKELSYQKLHQTVAMESLFPGELKFCDLDRAQLKDWPDEEIIACGLLTKKGENFFFSHETFREFYAAKFILRILVKESTEDCEMICGYLIRFLTIQKFGLVRMFLNEGLTEVSKEKFASKKFAIAKGFFKRSEDLENLFHIFEENLENLAEFLIEILKNGIDEQVYDILFKNQTIILSAAKHTNLFETTQNFIIECLNRDDLWNFLKKNAIFLSIVSSSQNPVVIQKFLHKLQDQTDSKFVKNALQMKDKKGNNLVVHLIESNHTSKYKFQTTFQILKTFLNVDEFANLIMNCNKSGENILQICLDMDKVDIFKIILTEVWEFFASQDSLKQFKTLMNQKTSVNNQNILHYAAFCNRIDFHKILWKFLLQAFKNREELNNSILQGDEFGRNFVHYLVPLCKTDIVEFTFKKIKGNVGDDQYGEILKSKGQLGKSLLQIAAWKSKDIKLHKILWKNFQDFCKSEEEFLIILKEVDCQNCNVFHLAAAFSTTEIFEFMIKELQKITTREEIRNILSTLGLVKRNLLQSAARQNKSLEFHQSLWNIIQKYFEPSEILDMIKHVDNNGNNLLHCVVKFNTVQIAELTWKQIQIFITANKDQVKYLNRKGYRGRTLLEMPLSNPVIDSEMKVWMENLLQETTQENPIGSLCSLTIHNWISHLFSKN